MAQKECVVISLEDRARLAAVVGDRNLPQKHVRRARFVLLSDERLAVLEIAHLVRRSRKQGKAPVATETVSIWSSP